MPHPPRQTRPIDRPTIAVSMGDPLGIGPEVIVRALADRSLRRRARFHIHGLGAPLADAADACAIEPFWWRVTAKSALLDTTLVHDVVLLDHDQPDDPFETGARREPTKRGGEVSFRLVEAAIEDAQRPESDVAHADAIVTAPISKAAWALAGKGKYPGHTELLTTRFGARRTRMMFVAPNLRVILVTTHIPLMEIRNVLTIGRVFDTIDLGAEACRELGVQSPRIAVCGLNPHASEGGLMGDEEDRIIKPATLLADEAGLHVSGPHPADTVFRAALGGDHDLVVAMYHDQGLIPVKTVAFDRAVNLTVGLASVRTSPDHGTAYDIAGKGIADAGSMRAAIDLALTMAESRRRSRGAAALTRE